MHQLKSVYLLVIRVARGRSCLDQVLSLESKQHSIFLRKESRSHEFKLSDRFEQGNNIKFVVQLVSGFFKEKVHLGFVIFSHVLSPHETQTSEEVHEDHRAVVLESLSVYQVNQYLTHILFSQYLVVLHLQMDSVIVKHSFDWS